MIINLNLDNLNHYRKYKGILYKIDEKGCWIWQRSVNQNGYGRIKIGGKDIEAHKFFYEWMKGQVPENKVLDHKCQNTLCINPNHLRIVGKGRNSNRERSESEFCKHGHERTPENLIYNTYGYKVCKIC